MCSICLVEDILNISIMDCGHKYCKECIDGWFDKGNNTCPMCRKEIIYFKNNDDNYRLIIKKKESTLINTELLIRYVRCHKIARFLSITLILMIYYIYNISNNNKILLDNYNSCEYNYTNVLSILLVKKNNLVKCDIPITYFNNC